MEDPFNDVPVIRQCPFPTDRSRAIARPEPWSAADIGALIAETKAKCIALHATARPHAGSPSIRVPTPTASRTPAPPCQLSRSVSRGWKSRSTICSAPRKSRKSEEDAAYQTRVEEATAQRDALAQELAGNIRTSPATRGPVCADQSFRGHTPVGVDPVESAGRGLKPNGIHWLMTSVLLPAFALEDHAMGRTVWPPAIEHRSVLALHAVVASAARSTKCAGSRMQSLILRQAKSDRRRRRHRDRQETDYR